MYTPLCLRSRYALHTVHTAFILENSVNTVARNRQHYLLEAAGSAFAGRSDSYVPSAALTVLHIHLAEIAGEKSGLVAACAATDLQYGVLGIFRVSRNKLELDLLFQPGQSSSSRIKLILGHLAHLRIVFAGKDLFCLVDIGKQSPVTARQRRKTLQILVLLRKTHVALHIRNDGGIGNKRGNLFKPRLYSIETLQQGQFGHVLYIFVQRYVFFPAFRYLSDINFYRSKTRITAVD